MARAKKQLLANPKFLNDANGWYLESAVLESDRSGRNHVTILGDAQQTDLFSALIVTVDNIPVGIKLQLSFYLKCPDERQVVQVKAYTFDAEGKAVNGYITQTLAPKAYWAKVETTFYASPGSQDLTIWIINPGKNRVSVKGPSLTTIGTPFTQYSMDDCRFVEQSLPNVIEVSYGMAVEPRDGNEYGSVYFPVPGLYREQYPITFELSTEPKSALLDYRLYQRSDGTNWICQADLRVAQTVRLRWRSSVIVKARQSRKLVKAPVIPPPPQVAEWLKSTVCVQVNDSAIQSKSKELTEGVEDVETRARRIIQFVSTNTGLDGENFDSLDAKRALTHRGSCTSCANLAVALLRASGIAARTIAHMPIWGGWMHEHWMVEYWHPGEGWICLESALNQFEPSPNSLVILAVSGADDEDRSLDPDYLRTIMPGAPYLASALLSSHLDNSWDTATNFAIELGKISGTIEENASLFQVAERVFRNLTLSNLATAKSTKLTPKLMAAIASGSAKRVERALRTRQDARNHMT